MRLSLRSAGEIVSITLQISADAASSSAPDLQLRLKLPTSFVVQEAGGGQPAEDGLSWSVGQVTNETTFQTVVTLQTPNEAIGTVYRIEAELSHVGFEATANALLVTIADPNQSLVVLLDPALSDVQVEATPLDPSQADDPATTRSGDKESESSTSSAEPSEETVTTSPGLASLYLPVLQQAATTAEAEQSANSAPAVETAANGNQPSKNDKPSKPAKNRKFYKLWQINAKKQMQQIEKLDRPALVVFRVSDLIAQGIDTSEIAVWTRSKKKDLWQHVRSEYDANRQLLYVWTNHFSQWTLGNGLKTTGQIMPSMRGFSSDAFTGYANFSLAVESPKGLGGLSPNLSLVYSSGTMDDLFNDQRADQYLTQANWAGGLGWSLGGLSYISRDHSRTVPTYYLILNGTSVKITWENNAWKSDPYSFLKIDHWAGIQGYYRYEVADWTITTPDGTKYYFGANTYDANGEPTTAHTAMLMNDLCCYSGQSGLPAGWRSMRVGGSPKPAIRWATTCGAHKATTVGPAAPLTAMVALPTSLSAAIAGWVTNCGLVQLRPLWQRASVLRQWMGWRLASDQLRPTEPADQCLRAQL